MDSVFEGRIITVAQRAEYLVKRMTFDLAPVGTDVPTGGDYLVIG